MSYKNVPPDEKHIVGEMMTDFRQRVGEKAFQEFLQISRKLDAIREEYGREPQPGDPQLPHKDTEDSRFLELAELFYSALKEDAAIRDWPKDKPIDDETMQAAVERTVERLKAEGKITTAEVAAALPSIGGKRIKELGFPIDKVNANIWKLLEKDMGGQIAIAAESSKSKKQLNIYYSINFEEIDKDVTITRQLEPFDKRVYIAIGALWAAGQQIITIGQIYDAMGYAGEPGSADYQRITTSVMKMMGARIYINNAEEAKAYKYDKFVYHASLLPMERIDAIVNGKTVNSAIHLFREPPLISFARGRKQITTVKRQLLTTPLSKTNANIMLEDYLIERIAHAKSGKLSPKIKYSTIFEEAHITEKKQRQRAPAKVQKILTHYQKCGHIKGFEVEPDGIRLNL